MDREVFLHYLVSILILLGTINFLCFPLVSITSGELKPRGIFVDEHAFVIAGLTEEPATAFLEDKSTYLYSIQRTKMDSVEADLDWIKRSEEIPMLIKRHNKNLLEVFIQPLYRPTSLESSVLVLPIYPNSNALGIEVLLNIISIVSKKKWLSRNLIVLFINIEFTENEGNFVPLNHGDVYGGKDKYIRLSGQVEHWLSAYTSQHKQVSVV